MLLETRQRCLHGRVHRAPSPGTDALEKAKKAVSTAPHYDSSREVHEFKGFYLKEV